jgi:hypothetical protein
MLLYGYTGGVSVFLADSGSVQELSEGDGGNIAIIKVPIYFVMVAWPELRMMQ